MISLTEFSQVIYTKTYLGKIIPLIPHETKNQHQLAISVIKFIFMKELAYKIINALTLGKGLNAHVSGFRVKLPTRYFRYFPIRYEMNVLNFFNNYVKEGMVVIDAGAHIGLHSAILAQKTGPTGKVIAFEPTPDTFELLKKTIAINGIQGTVIPMQQALAAEKGKATFYVSTVPATNSNSLSDNKRANVNEKAIEVDITTIDDLVSEQSLSRVDLIKIDVEGAEYSLLKGATATLTKFHPRISLDVHPIPIKNFGDSLGEIWDFVIKHDYKVYYHHHLMTREEFIKREDLFDVFLM